MPQTSDGCLREPDPNGVNRWSLPIEGDSGLKPPSPWTVRKQSSLTGFTTFALGAFFIIKAFELRIVL